MQSKIDKSNVQDIFELSMVQRGMLFHYLKDESENLYNVQLSLKVEGDLDVSLFRKSLDLVQNNNEVLRSVFSWEKLSKPFQIFLKQLPIDYSFYDLSKNDSENAKEFIDEYLREDQQKRFNLNQSLFRICLIKESFQSYLFILTHHHVLYDGWSTGILMKEIFSYYKELKSLGTIQTIKKPTYKEIQFQIKKRRDVEKERSYWKNYLNDFDIQLLFSEASDHSLKKEQIQKLQISNPIGEIEAFVVEQKITKAALIYAAYGILLQKYSNSSDVVFGTVISNRDAAIGGFERVVGNFINTIPLRFANMEMLSLREIASKVNTELINRNQYCGTSYFELKQLLGLKPKENLFDAVVAVENYPLDKTLIKNHPELSIELNSVYENSDVPLMIAIFFQEKLEFEITYKDCLVKEPFVQKMISHWIKIIHEIIESPNKKISEVCLLSPNEKNKILTIFNDTKEDYPKKETVVSLFEKQFKRTPDEIAVAFKEEKISYAQLNNQANSIAEKISAMTEGQNHPIGLLFNPSIEMISAMLGILKSGNTYVPLSIDASTKRNQFIVSDCGAKLLLIEERALKDRPGLSSIIEKNRTLIIGKIDHSVKESSYSSINGSPEELLYIIYTSGTTGKPKGVEVKNRGMVNMLTFYNKIFGIKEKVKVSQVANGSFDASASEIWPCLIGGGCLIIASAEERFDPRLMKTWLIDNEIEVSFQPTVIAEKLLQEDWTNHETSLKKMIVAGDRFHHELVNPLPFQLFNNYGPTEDSIWSTWTEIDLNHKSSTYSIGKPIANKRIFILDKANNLQPIGIPGEICIAGDGLARGYVNNEAMTAEKFIENPFAPNERLYKTGDLGNWLPDGNIEFLGRIDKQIKIRGFRIELGAIEFQLNNFPNVKESAVIDKGEGEDKYLIAYYVAPKVIDTSLLKKYLLEELPSYMVPSYFVHIETLPVTSNGKLDRKALPTPAFNTIVDHQLPANKIEEKLLNIWSDILKVTPVNISTNQSFFDLGGHSLKATGLVNKIHENFGCKIPLAEIFNNDTIENLADYLITIKQLDIASEIPNDNMEIFL